MPLKPKLLQKALAGNGAYYLSILGVLFLLFSVRLFSDGMFLDGLIYATVSRNMGEGLGTFWSPYFSSSLFLPEFHEHPPLAFWLQSLCFRLLGDSLLVERIYSVVVLFIAAFQIHSIWKRLTKQPGFSFFPILLWILFRGVTWAYANNLLENSMTLFVLASFQCYLISRERHRLPWLVLTGLSITLAFLTKGPTGMFTLVLPGIYWMVNRDKFVRFAGDQLILITSAIVPILLLLFLSPDAKHFLSIYFQAQVKGSVAHVVTVSHRWFILTKLLEIALPPLAVCAIIAAHAKRISGVSNYQWKPAVTLLVISLSGILPITISMKQRAFYLNCALPFLALGLAILLLPALQVTLQSISQSKWWSRGIYIFNAVSITIGVWIMVSTWGQATRDEEFLPGFHQSLKLIPPNSEIGLSPSLERNALIHAYYARYGKITLDAAGMLTHRMILLDSSREIPDGYRKVLVITPHLSLYSKTPVKKENPH